jgi:hypothetical protein
VVATLQSMAQDKDSGCPGQLVELGEVMGWQQRLKLCICAVLGMEPRAMGHKTSPCH